MRCSYKRGEKRKIAFQCVMGAENWLISVIFIMEKEDFITPCSCAWRMLRILYLNIIVLWFTGIAVVIKFSTIFGSLQNTFCFAGFTASY